MAEYFRPFPALLEVLPASLRSCWATYDRIRRRLNAGLVRVGCSPFVGAVAVLADVYLDGREVKCRSCSGQGWQWRLRRGAEPCGVCDGFGVVVFRWGELVGRAIEAGAVNWVVPAYPLDRLRSETESLVCGTIRTHRPEQWARDLVAVKADELQAQGNPLGLWLAAVLEQPQWGRWHTYPLQAQLDEEVAMVVAWYMAETAPPITRAVRQLQRQVARGVLPALRSFMGAMREVSPALRGVAGSVAEIGASFEQFCVEVRMLGGDVDVAMKLLSDSMASGGQRGLSREQIFDVLRQGVALRPDMTRRDATLLEVLDQIDVTQMTLPELAEIRAEDAEHNRPRAERMFGRGLRRRLGARRGR
jgi:hypothetical protein